MAEPFISQIVMFGGNFAPRSWAYCDGQLVAIPSNSALFSLLGTTFGGDGRSTFGYPDMRSRVAVHTGGNSGTGPGLSTYQLGQKGGSETNTLVANQLPSHTHATTAKVNVSTDTGTEAAPNGNFLAQDSVGDNVYQAASTSSTLATGAMSVDLMNNGGSQPVTNIEPYLAVHFIIAIYGIYPSRY